MAADLELHLSGGAANTDKNAALGGARSTAGGGVVPKALTANSFFDDVTGAESTAGDTEYRCVYLRNVGTVDATSTVIWLSGNTADTDTDIALTLGTSGIGASTTEQTVANENTAPTGVAAFTSPATEGTGIAVGTIPAGQHKAIWLRRTVNAAAGSSADQFTVAAAFDSAP